jgi:hypothetical protein
MAWATSERTYRSYQTKVQGGPVASTGDLLETLKRGAFASDLAYRRHTWAWEIQTAVSVLHGLAASDWTRAGKIASPACLVDTLLGVQDRNADPWQRGERRQLARLPRSAGKLTRCGMVEAACAKEF